MKKTDSRRAILWLCLTALFMAMNVALSSFGVPVPGGHLYMNDIVICTAAILFDPLAAFLVGGVGAFLGDFFFYPAPMFVSLITHGFQAIVISVFSRYFMKKHPAVSSGIGVTLGALINVVGYSLGRRFFYGSNRTMAVVIAKLPYQIAQAAVGAVLAMVICYAFGLKKLAEKEIEKQLH